MDDFHWGRLDHIQIAIPPGSEEACRSFYCGLLGWNEVSKPASLAGRGGLWLRTATFEVHLGVEQDFRPAKKAHPAFTLKKLDELATKLLEGGHSVVWDDLLPGKRRFFSYDNEGNRLEFIESSDENN